MEEIYERIPHVTVVLNSMVRYVEVKRKVQEVVVVGMLFIHFIRQQLQAVLIGNVLDHDGGSPIPFDHVVVDLEDSAVDAIILLGPLVRVELRIKLLLASVTERVVE